MICTTGLERDLEALAQRLERGFHELRLDALAHIDDAVFELIARHGEQLIVCFRPERQGGLYRGDENARLEVLKRAAQRGARYVDVEHDVPEAALAGIAAPQRLLSLHDFGALPADLKARARQLEGRAAIVKIACRVEDPAELMKLFEVRDAFVGEAVLIGMGAAGALSRIRYQSFGSPWTYVAGEPTAPGQLSSEEARLFGLPASASEPLYVLCGGPSVLMSPGPRVYNRLFRERSLGGVYAALACSSLASVMPLLVRLGVRGVSVTMPHKQEALACATPDAVAQRVGAANSLKLSREGWQARNTDVTGVREPLARVGAHGKALVLGAGGAARAAIEALRELGLEVEVRARSAGWDGRAEVECDVLVNATALGGDESPWPDAPLRARVVFDLAMSSRPSRLCARAREEGRIAIEPLEMWRHQGAEQMSWFVDAHIAPEELTP